MNESCDIVKNWKKFRNRGLMISVVALIVVGCVFAWNEIWNSGGTQNIHGNTPVQFGSSAGVKAPSSAADFSSAGTSHASSSSGVVSSALPQKNSLPPSASATSPSQADSQVKNMLPSEYQGLYPDLYAQKLPVQALPAGKVVYLTFDDGPSNLTRPLLDVLDRYGVKATFFVIGKTGKQDLQDMRDIVKRGHTIGMHSYTHNYQQIYADPKAFLSDLERIHALIQNTTGVDAHLYRFPGGSYNSYNHRYADQIIAELDRRGYTYFDWNVDSGDAKTGTSAAAIYSNAVRGARRYGKSVILMHNTNVKHATLAELPSVIATLQKSGYRFATLDETVDNRDFIFPKPKT